MKTNKRRGKIQVKTEKNMKNELGMQKQWTGLEYKIFTLFSYFIRILLILKFRCRNKETRNSFARDKANANL